MEESIKRKIEIQETAEKAHESFGCKSSICLSMGLGKSKIAINRIVKQFSKKEEASVLFTGAREIYLTNFKNELIKFNHENLIEKITFCCIASLEKFQEKTWDCVIVDRFCSH